jgi:hypothetical protein
MDGISPTLAFAVILFGLSDNPRDTADKANEATADNRCPVLMMGDPMQSAAPQSWTEAFWRVADDTTAVPDIIDPRWDDPGLPLLAQPAPASDVASAALMPGDDPIARRAVPAAESGPVAEPGADPCMP